MAVAAKKPVFEPTSIYTNLVNRGWRYKSPQEGTFGIEIETETAAESAYPTGFFTTDDYAPNRLKVKIPGWEAHLDNSLRNFGREFVLEKPLLFKDALTALDAFGEETKDIKFIKKAPATSVHVHVNMLPETPLTLANFLSIYSLFENVLVDYSGESRRSNLFALPVRVAEKTIDHIIELLGFFLSGDESVMLDESRMKYAALNLAPLSRFGSVEIRSFRGETNPVELKLWLTIVNKILEYARKPELNPLTVLFEYKVRRSAFLEEVFGEVTEQILSKVNDVSELIERNVWYLYKIATVTNDWSKIVKRVESKASKKLTAYELSETELAVAEMHLHTINNSPPSTTWANLGGFGHGTIIVDEFSGLDDHDDLDEGDIL